MIKKPTKIDPYSAVLLLILALNAVLKWRYFCGLVAADDFSYSVYSYSMFRLPMSWDMSMDFRVLRLALLLPVTFLFRFLPPVDFVAVLYPMAVSFGSVVLVYLIGKKLYGVNAGILAAFVLATFPADIIYSTMLLPDGVVPFFLCLSVWSFLNADSETGRRAKLWYLAAGFSLFLAFITRENSYYFLLFFLPYAFKRERWNNGLYLFGAGFALPVVVLYSIYYVKSGDFLFNLHLAQHYRDPLIESGYIPENSRNWYSMLYLMFPGFFMKLTGRPVYLSALFGVTFYAGIFCVVYTTVKAFRKRDFRLLLAPWWFLIVYLYLEYGTISFSSYQMMRKLDRFLLTLTPAMAMAFGVVISDVLGLGGEKLINRKLLNEKIRKFKKTKLRHLSAFIMLVVLAYVFYTSFEVLDYQKTGRDNNLRIFRWGYYQVLKDKPHRPIYDTGGWWKNKLSFYYLPDLRYAEMPWRRSDMFRDLQTVSAPSELAGSYVILDRRHFSGENDLRIKHSYDDFVSYVKLPPEDWRLLGRNYDVEIYEVPGEWDYVEPDGKKLVLDSFYYSMKIGDFMLFTNCLHPDLISSLTEEQFAGLVKILVDKNNPVRSELLGERLEYRKHNGRWKIGFNLQEK